MDRMFYENLVTTGNNNKPKFMALLRAVLEQGVSMQAVSDSMTLSFDLENAAGSQLDVLGKLVGVSRLLKFTPTVGDRNMTDEEYREVLQLKAIQNIWDGTNEGAMKAYNVLAQNGIHLQYTDNQDMTVLITIFDAKTTREAEMLEYAGCLPIPLGVGYQLSISGGTSSADAEIAETAVTGIGVQETAVLL